MPVLPGKIGAPMRHWLAASVSTTQSPFTLSEQVQDWGSRQRQFEAPVAISRGREAPAMTVNVQISASDVPRCARSSSEPVTPSREGSQDA